LPPARPERNTRTPVADGRPNCLSSGFRVIRARQRKPLERPDPSGKGAPGFGHVREYAMTLNRFARLPALWSVLATFALSGCLADHQVAGLPAEPAPFHPSAIAAPWLPQAWPAADQFSGNWTVRDNASFGNCRIMLNPMHGRDQGTAMTFGCLGALFGAARWSLSGNMITIYNIAQEPLAMLWITAPDRMEGGGFVFSR